MRPRRLEIQGLRSYRQRQEIDFTGANLVAILGDTGAGKSSILEALCVALYTGSTWDKRSVKALISSGLPTLDVVLEFTADGKEWKVHRSFPAGNYPPATHLLIGITDGSQLNGAREVNERIVELVGLDYDAFLRAVLLPQGRFQALLQATGGERTSILKGIFRLDVLERVREVARTRAEELAVRLADLQVQRAKLLQDPATAAALAEREHAEAAREQQRLKTATEAVRVANQTETELQRAAGLLDRSARTARDQDPAASLGEIGRLVALAKEVEAKRTVELARRTKLDAELGALAASLKKAEAAGLGYDALLGADRTVAELLEWIEKDAAARAQLGADEKQNAERSKRLDGLRTEVETLERRFAAAKAEVEQTRAERDAARKAFDDARRLLEAARVSQRQRDQRRTLLVEREKNVAACRKELTEATSKAKASTTALKVAEKTAAEARRGHAAAHAAADIETGDPCPVCDRKLPAGWKAPVAKDLKKAEGALAAAVAAEQACQAQVTKSSVRSEELDKRLNEDRAALENAEQELRVAVAALHELAGKGADPAATGDAPLEQLEHKVAAAAKRFDEMERARGGHEKTLREREAERTGLEAEVKQSEKQVAATRARLDLDQKAGERKLASLPEPLRTASLETKPLEAARKRATKELEAAKVSRAREQELGTALRDVQTALSALDQQRNGEVTKPTSVIARKLDDLRRALEDLASEVEGDAPPKSDADAPSEVAAWARELGASREKLLRGVDARARQIDSELAAARQKVTAALSLAGVESEAVLDARSTDVAVTLQRKAEDLALARGQIALAAELDRRIAGGAPLVDALRELARLLTDGKFIGHVVDRKQQSLLVVASKLLGDMTKNRYGFSQAFDVVDRLTGEPRSVMTLSGGETFLASLALALGLVELAGREGGRLDALFLDEGFGSLDANALAEALEALEQQAAKGRMVAVISHLHAVAESIERVLRVERTPAGSRAQWLSESERAALLEQEATAGLLI